MHFDDLAGLAESTDEKDLTSRLSKLGVGLGFPSFGAHIWDETGGGKARGSLVIDVVPDSYKNIFRSVSGGQRCPVFQRIKTTGTPFAYDQMYYASHGAGEMWEEQAPYGFKVGVACGFHLPRGRHFLFGFDGDGPLPGDENALARLIADFHLIASYACEAAIGVEGKAARDDLPVLLTDRQLEVLGWTSAGKTAWEIGQVMSINERTVVAHLSEAMRKLECVNKTQAVSKAIRRGLIS